LTAENIDELISDAFFMGHMTQARRLLKGGFDPNTVFEGSPLVSLAAGDGRYDIVTLLLEAGADPNVTDEDDYTPLATAVSRGYPGTVSALIKGGADPDISDPDGETTLHTAVARDNADVLQALLSASENPNKVNSNGWSPLHSAINFGRRENVEVLVRHGVSLNQYWEGKTTLSLASFGGHADIAEFLLQKPKLDPNEINEDGGTPLTDAIYAESVETLIVLLNHGADPNEPTRDGSTPLSVAASSGGTDVVRELLRVGANPNDSYEGASSPIVEAAMEGHVEIIYLLCAHGADPNMPDAGEVTALGMATYLKKQDSIDALVSNGATE